LQIPAIVIGSILAFICFSSLILNIYYYKSHDLSKDRLLTNQWSLCIILMFST
jgi:integral membrane sensor domain MASE1